jgi:glycosyltransferase involved in cell wall biosynthesis
MKVLIIATGIAPRIGGVGHYERQLLPYLAASLTARECQVTVLLSRNGRLSDLDAGVRVVRLPVSRNPGILRIFAEHLYIPALGFGADVTVALDHRFPLLPVKAGRTLVVVHDVLPLQQKAGEFPTDTNAVRRWQYSLTITRAIKAADTLVADSQFTASQIARFFPVAPRISVIPLGIDHERFHPLQRAEEIERLRRLYGLPAQFYLFVGSLSFHKNLRLIVDAYSSGDLPRQYMLPVVLVGPSRNDDPSNPTLQLIDNNGIGKYFQFLGYIPDAHLPVLYASAKALIHPAWCEGFGLPPLEAMACGTPVIASNRTAVPEVVGDAALLVDPGSSESLVQALQRVTDDAIRKQLIERGLKRAAAYTWQRTAEMMAKAICDAHLE